MYEHEDKLLVRDFDGVLRSARVTVNGAGGCSVVLLEETYASKPHGATPVTADAIRRQHNLEVGQSYPAVEVDNTKKDSEVTTNQSEQDKIAAMVKKTTAATTTASHSGNK